jgi:hypothetical protein
LQAHEIGATGSGPFMAVLRKILLTGEVQADTEQACVNQAVEERLADLFGALPGLESLTNDSWRAPRDEISGTGQYMGVLQGLIYGHEARPEAVQNEPTAIEELLCLFKQMGGSNISGECMSESNQADLVANQTEDTGKRSVQEMILGVLTQLLQVKNITDRDKAGCGPKSGDVCPEEGVDQDKSDAAPLAEAPEETQISSGQGGREGTDSQTERSLEEQDSLPGLPATVENRHPAGGPPQPEKIAGETDEETSLAAEDLARPEPLAQTPPPLPNGAGYASPFGASPEAGALPLNRFAQEIEANSQGVVGIDDLPQRMNDQTVAAQTSFTYDRSAGNGGSAPLGYPEGRPYDGVKITDKNSAMVDGGDTPQGMGDKGGNGDDLRAGMQVLYSKFQAAEDGNRQAPMNPNGGGALENPGTIGAKTTNNDGSFPFGKAEPQAITLERLSTSDSFDKGEKDPNHLGQGFVSQRVMERAFTRNGDVTQFGDIVAERISRIINHMAQTSRSDLTLRLKIDGSESVFLEMKERAGVTMIGIHCQDRTLMKALESQRETMVRNLETKNLNASISITRIGDDEQDGHRQWQRGRHEQRRENGGGRGERYSAPYFEAIL